MTERRQALSVSAREAHHEPILRLALTIDEACIASTFSRPHLYKEAKAGRLRLTKRGRRTIILIEDLRAWLHGAQPVSK